METAIISSLVNFGLVVGTLVYVGRKPLAQFLSVRSDSIKDSIQEAEKLSSESLVHHSHWSGLLKGSPSEVQKLKSDLEAQIQKSREEGISSAKHEAERVVRDSELAIETEYLRAREKLETEICQGSVDLARDYLSEHLVGDTSSELFNQTLERVSDGKRV